jgi:putative phosphoesterase
MRMGIVSDVHCHHQGLAAALELMGDVDELLCLGDSIYESRFSNEVVAMLRERGAHIIQGNHEEMFFSPAGGTARHNPAIDPDLLQFLAAQPIRRTLTVDGLRLLLVHSTPCEPRGAYIYPHSKDLARFGEVDADVVLDGHTHTQLVRQIDDVLVINPGSAGNAQDPSNGKQLSCAVLETAGPAVQIYDFPDPARMAAAPRLANNAHASGPAEVADRRHEPRTVGPSSVRCEISSKLSDATAPGYETTARSAPARAPFS